MNTIELFSGTASFSKVMAKHGHRTFTLDINPKFRPDLIADIGYAGANDFPYRPDILWASPPCQGFSVAAIGKNWAHPAEGIYMAKTKSAREAMNCVWNTVRLINLLQPKWYFIENPRAMLRKMSIMAGRIRHTVTYCQYGDTRQKPTDIWTNAEWWWPRPPCSPGSSCHESAPRGSKTGTQGLRNSEERGVIPPAIFEEILEQLGLFHREVRDV